MESNLFIELAEEQQEVVSGGAADGLFNTTSFSGSFRQQTGSTSSGPFGSTSTSTQINQTVDTRALQAGVLNFLTADAPGIVSITA
jgi:hypothetical protein